MNQTHYAICTLIMLFEAVVLFLIAIFCSIGERVTWILWFKDTLRENGATSVKILTRK